MPADGLPDGLRIAPGERHYHSYSTPDGPVRLDPARLMQGVIDSPTVAPPRLVRPATPQGAQNEATPSEPYNAFVGLTAAAAPFGHPLPPVTSFNPVKSYLTTGQNGTPVVVNVTQPGHGLSPGVVIRYVTTSPSGSTIQTEGTGLGPLQGPGILGIFRDKISNVWKGQAEDIIRTQSERRR